MDRKREREREHEKALDLEREKEQEAIIIRHKSRNGLLNKFLCLVLGIIIGIVGGIGGVGYAGYYALTKMKIQQGMDLVNTYAGLDIDYTQYLNGKYGEMTVMDLIGDVGTALDQISAGTGSLNTLNEISPYISTLVVGDPTTEEEDGLINDLKKYGVELNATKLMGLFLTKPEDVTEKNPDLYLTDYLTESVNAVEVPALLELLNIPTDNEILQMLCYSEDGARTIGDLMTMDFMSEINNIPLDTFLKPSKDNGIMMHLSYGSAHRYTVGNDGVDMNPMFFTLNDTFDKAFDDMGEEVKNSLISAYDPTANTCTLTITETKDTETIVTVYYLKGVDDKYFAYADSAFTEEILFPKTTIGSLQGGMDIIYGLAVKDALGVDPSDPNLDAIYKALCLKDGELVTIKDLQSATFLKSIALKDFLNVKESDTGILAAICFKGDKKDPVTIGELNESFFNGITLKDFLNVKESDTGILASICFKTVDDQKVPVSIGELNESFFNGIALKDFLNVKETDEGFLASICFKTENDKKVPVTIGELNNDFFNGIYLKDVLGEDENTMDAFKKALCYVNGNTDNPRTIGQLTQIEDFVAEFGYLPLDTLLTPEKDDAVMMNLCYGPAHRYIVNADGVTMQPMYFTLDDHGKVFDDQGEELKNYSFIPEGGGILELIITDDNNKQTVYYLQHVGDKYFAYEDENLTTAVTFPKTKIGDLQGGNLDIVNNLYLKDVLTDATPGTFMYALCYDENGKARKLNDLTQPGFVDGLYLKDVLTDVTPDSFMYSLCYVDGNTNNPRKISDLTQPGFVDGLYLKDVLTNVTPGSFMYSLCYVDGKTENPRKISDLTQPGFVDGLYLKDVLTDVTPGSFMYSLCYVDGNTNTPRKISDLTKEGFVDGLYLKDVMGVTFAQATAFEKSLCFINGDENQPRKISELDDDFVNDLALSDVLNVPLDTSDPIMKAICFNGTTPRKVSELNGDIIDTIALKDVLGVTDDSTGFMHAICYKNGEEVLIGDLNETFFNDILLADILPADNDNALVMYLIYGKKDIHYTEELIDGKLTPVMLQKRVAVCEDYVFDEYGDYKIADYDKANKSFTLDGKTYYVDTTVALGEVDVDYPVGNTTVHKTATYYYVTDANGQKVMFKPSTLGDLTKEDASLLSNITQHLTVYDILGAEMDEDSLLKHIGHVPINDMAKAVAELKIIDMFESDIYYKNANGELTDKDGNTTDTHGNPWTKESREAIKPTWRYLLKTNVWAEDAEGNKYIASSYIDTDLTVQVGMTQMMSNMTENIQNAPLRQLIEDEIIALSGAAADKYRDDPDNEMFDLTLPQAISKMFEAMSTLEQLKNDYPLLFPNNP